MSGARATPSTALVEAGAALEAHAMRVTADTRGRPRTIGAW
jgi:hypothetical protein